MDKSKEILCQQLELLAEQSKECSFEELLKITDKMISLYCALARGWQSSDLVIDIEKREEKMFYKKKIKEMEDRIDKLEKEGKEYSLTFGSREVTLSDLVKLIDIYCMERKKSK